jgi:hypothetical protein
MALYFAQRQGLPPAPLGGPAARKVGVPSASAHQKLLETVDAYFAPGLCHQSRHPPHVADVAACAGRTDLLLQVDGNLSPPGRRLTLKRWR